MSNINPQVLMFGWELPPDNSGGLGVACYGLAKSLSQQGVKISFALPRKLKTNIEFMKVLDHHLQGVDITAINSQLKGYLSESEYDELIANGFNRDEILMYGQNMCDEAIRFGEMAANWSKNQSHDVIHAHDWMTYPAGLKAKQISGRPLVTHVHATEYDRTGGMVNSKIAEIEYQGLQKADRVIAVSEYTKGVINKYYGVDDEKISVVHNGVDLSEFSPIKMKQFFPGDKVVLYVGRLTFQKGVSYFLQAAKKVLTYQPNTIFLVVGKGDMYQRLIMEACNLGIGHRTVFAGFQNGDKLRACYQAADVFVMPSVSEPYGIVALEAIASGIPAVISKQSGVIETITNVLTVDFWDTEVMADKILSVLSYPKLAHEMNKAAMAEAKSMNWDKAAQLTLNVYRSVL